MNTLLYNEKTYFALAAYLRSGRLPHAILLEGSPGTGKSTLAREIAQGALCTAELSQRPCGVCRDCVKVDKQIHPDLLVYAGDGGSRSFHVDLVRALRQEAYIRPNEGQCKVFILENVHYMTPQAGNALLKIIEEPPSGVIFILTCENKAALLDTILSRVALVSLQTPTVEQCIQALALLCPDQSDEQRQNAASRSGGSIGIAQQLLEPGVGKSPLKALLLLESLCLGSELDVLAQLSTYERDKDGLVEILNSLAQTVRELLRETRVDEPATQRLCSRTTSLQRLQILAIIEETVQLVPQNVNRLALVTNMCAKIKLVLSR